MRRRNYSYWVKHNSKERKSKKIRAVNDNVIAKVKAPYFTLRDSWLSYLTSSFLSDGMYLDPFIFELYSAEEVRQAIITLYEKGYYGAYAVIISLWKDVNIQGSLIEKNNTKELKKILMYSFTLLTKTLRENRNG